MQDDERLPQQKRSKRDLNPGQGEPINYRVTEEDTEDDDMDTYPNRPRTSSIRLRNPMDIQTTGQPPIRRSAGLDPNTGQMLTPRAARSRQAGKPPAPRNEQRGIHWLLYVGIGMLAMLALWVVGSAALAWGIARYDDIVYGNPRTFQTDAVVGHDDDAQHPSHFIAINLNRHIVIIEFMGGNPAKSISYGGPYLYEAGGDKVPVTLEFRDVTGGGKPDMLIHIQDQTIVFVNTGTQFRPANSSDHIHL
jgi:hypothetical protein